MDDQKHDLNYRLQVHREFIYHNRLMSLDIIDLILSFYYTEDLQLKFLLAKYYANQRDMKLLQGSVKQTTSISKQKLLKNIQNKLNKQCHNILQHIRIQMMSQRYTLNLYVNDSDFNDEIDHISTEMWILPTSIRICLGKSKYKNKEKTKKRKSKSKRDKRDSRIKLDNSNPKSSNTNNVTRKKNDSGINTNTTIVPSKIKNGKRKTKTKTSKNKNNDNINISRKGNLRASNAKHLRQLKRQNSIEEEKKIDDKIHNIHHISDRIEIDIESEYKSENKQDDDDERIRILEKEILETLSIGYKNLLNVKRNKHNYKIMLSTSGNNGNNGINNSYKFSDTLRGQLWRAMLGVSGIDLRDYLSQLRKTEDKSNYVHIRNDVNRLFIDSNEYCNRAGVDTNGESVLIRILNSYCHKYNKKYFSGMHWIAATMLCVMPELDSYYSFNTIINRHLPTYFCYLKSNINGTDNGDSNINNSNNNNQQLSGKWAACFLTFEVIRLFDKQFFDKINFVKPDVIFGCCASVQAIVKPFNEMMKLWDFLVCFGMHMNPIITAAQIISKKEFIIENIEKNEDINVSSTTKMQWLLTEIFSMSKWMNGSVDASKVIMISMRIMATMKQAIDRYRQRKNEKNGNVENNGKTINGQINDEKKGGNNSKNNINKNNIENNMMQDNDYQYELLWNRILKHGTDFKLANEMYHMMHHNSIH